MNDLQYVFCVFRVQMLNLSKTQSQNGLQTSQKIKTNKQKLINKNAIKLTIKNTLFVIFNAFIAL